MRSLLLGSIVLSAQLATAQLPLVASGEMYVSDSQNDRVAVYSAEGDFLRAFSAPGLDAPRGIAFAPNGDIFVASQSTNNVYRFDGDGVFLGTFTNPLLTSPTGMSVHPAGELHVSAFTGARICVFDLAGTFLRSYTAPGFHTPNCVTFDADGNIYAASAGNGSMFKWDAAENFLFEIEPPAGVSLLSPMGIAQDKAGVLYVGGGSSHNILRFQTDGTYLSEITHPDLTGPQGVVFDDRGHLFSSSFYDHRLVEFDETGTYVQTILEGNLNIPRSMAFDPGRPATVFPSLCHGDGGDGLGCSDCPCSNNANPGTIGGCLHSGGTASRLHVFGSASVSANDLRFEVTGGPANSFSILLSGASLAPTNPANPCFGTGSGIQSIALGGLRCVVGQIQRHGTRALGSEGCAGCTTPGWGGMDGPTAGLTQSMGATAGETRHFQVFVRDGAAGSCGTGLNTTQARSLLFEI